MQISATLIKSCARQDRKAQQQLYELLLPYLRAVANRYLRDTSYWKDVLQEGFVKIFRNIDQYNPDKAPFQQWAAKVVINTCLNHNNRTTGMRFDTFSIAHHDRPTPPSVAQDFSDEYLLSILKLMPNGYFEVFNLYVIDGFDHHEIAQMLGIDNALSRQRLVRAKNWLKNAFNENPALAANFHVSRFYLN